MLQMKVYPWTNPATAVAKNIDLGFAIKDCYTIDITNGGKKSWNSGMSDGYYLTDSSGAITTSNGFTPISQNALFGAAISGFTNDSPGVITASNITDLGFAAGDTIKVTAVAESGSSTSLNESTFTIASVTATTITLDQNTTSYNTYVSGGYVSRITDANGDPVATNNAAIRGVNLGTGAVGANNAKMVLVAYGD